MYLKLVKVRYSKNQNALVLQPADMLITNPSIKIKGQKD